MYAARSISRALCIAALLLVPLGTTAQITPKQRQEIVAEDDMVQLDFNDVELSVVIDTIARLTGTNFIYDDRVRGRVTIVSPTKIDLDQAYAVFESVLQVKGFTTVRTPGGVVKVIPIREAKESNIETVRGSSRTPDSDRFVTRLIPLRYIEAEAITATLKPLVSNNASMVAYAPTNTVIMTDSSSNIRRLMSILDSIDVETYKEDLAVLKIRHADASTMADQLSEIFGAEVSGVSASTTRRTRARRAGQPQAQIPGASSAITGTVRILTDDRTNSLLVMSSRSRLEEIREVVAKLDVPVSGTGRIHVYYLKHADAEELANTLNALVSGQPTGSSAGRGAAATPQALRAAISELAEGVTVTSDPPTNSLVIQASKEGFDTLSRVIDQLDIQRPQVLVEALIMEVRIDDGQDLGFNGVIKFNNTNTRSGIASIPTTIPNTGGDLVDGGIVDTEDGPIANLGRALLSGVAGTSFLSALELESGDTTITGVIRAAASDSRFNIVSAPHVLTSDNEEAEILVGQNIPIITSRTQQPATAGIVGDATFNQASNVERQDVGVTLRVTPQISEGDMVRLQIFQEISSVLSEDEQLGPTLSNRRVENTVVVNDEGTVVIGGIITDEYRDNVSKVPWLGDMPFFGWLFKSTSTDHVKNNLLIFLTPHIQRSIEDQEQDSIRKRDEFWIHSEEALSLSEEEREDAGRRRAALAAAGLDITESTGRDPVRDRLLSHSRRYPVERMLEIEREAEARTAREREAAETVENAPGYGVLAAVFRDENAAASLLTELVDAGYDGTLVSSQSHGAVMLELRLGPYEKLDQAEAVASTVRRSFGLDPTVYVDRDAEENGTE